MNRWAFLFLLLRAVSAAQTPDIGHLLATIAKYEQGGSREALVQFRAVVTSTPPSGRKAIEQRLLAFLQSKTTPAGREFALRELSLIGTEASVPVLARLLVKPETSEMARYALTRIPGPASDRALRDALAHASGDTRIGVINSLGQRRDAGSVIRLKGFLTPADPAAEAAAAALGRIGNETALNALAEARKRASKPGWLSEAYLDCATQLKSIKAYKELLASAEPENIRVAALGAIAEADSAAAMPALQATVESGKPALQAAAIRFLSVIPGADITESLVRRYAALDASLQPRLLKALADRGDTAALPLFVTVAGEGSGPARLAAFEGLGRLGGGANVALLARTAAASEGAEQTSARAALYRLRGSGVDKAIVDVISAGTGKEKRELIIAAGERGIPAAAGALITAVQSGDADLRRESLKALRGIAGAEQVPALVGFLEASSAAADRREIAQTLAAALKRSDASSIKLVLEAYTRTSAIPARVAILEVLGQTSSDAALPLLRESLRGSTPELARGAVLALTEWTTPTPLGDLYALAQSAPTPALSVLALRGYLKLLALPSDRAPAESARMLRDAMNLAKQTPEKRAILALLPSFPSPESLKIAEAALKEPAVAREARIALDRITSTLKFQ